MGLIFCCSCLRFGFFQIRKAPSQFNEAKQIVTCTYQLSLITLVVVPATLFVSDVQFVAVTRLVGPLLGITGTACQSSSEFNFCHDSDHLSCPLDFCFEFSRLKLCWFDHYILFFIPS
jgi:hypothetical protein